MIVMPCGIRQFHDYSPPGTQELFTVYEKTRTVKQFKSRNRQTAWRERMRDEGMVMVTGWVHEEQVPKLQSLLAFLRENPDVEPGPARYITTRKLVGYDK